MPSTLCPLSVSSSAIKVRFRHTPSLRFEWGCGRSITGDRGALWVRAAKLSTVNDYFRVLFVVSMIAITRRNDIYLQRSNILSLTKVDVFTIDIE